MVVGGAGARNMTKGMLSNVARARQILLKIKCETTKLTTSNILAIIRSFMRICDAAPDAFRANTVHGSSF